MKVAKCGTRSGYVAHVARKEPSCEDCRRAHREYMRTRYRESADVRAASSRQSSIRAKALGRLAALHPEEFRRLLAEEHAARKEAT